jgi:hypothetical protein
MKIIKFILYLPACLFAASTYFYLLFKIVILLARSYE